MTAMCRWCGWPNAAPHKVVVSIFVNPTQFAPTEDFGSYPRTWKADVAKLAAEKVDLIWNPDVKAMYPDGFATRIVTGRPGHWPASRTGSGRISSAASPPWSANCSRKCRPDFAMFGEKDFQQLRVVTRMARDLDLGVKVIGSPTVRERDGLAMSSRNVYLSPEERSAAPTLYRAMKESAKRLQAGDDLDAAMAAAPRLIAAAGFALDYFEARHAETLAPIASHRGWTDAAAGGGQDRQDAADRQYGLRVVSGLQSNPSSRNSRRIGSGIAATLAAAALPRSGGASFSVEIAPALERPHRPRRAPRSPSAASPAGSGRCRPCRGTARSR